MLEWMNKIRERPKWFIALLIIFYSVGMAGMWVSPDYFIRLSPINLSITTLILLFFSPLGNPDFRRFAILVAVVGFAIEIVGVKTGKVFGNYYYGSALGIKMGMVPLIIAFNWLVLTLSTLSITSVLKISPAAKIALGALLMVMLDVLIEPLSAKLDYWYWLNNEIPLRNFIGWTIVSVFFHTTAGQLNFEKYNPVAVAVFVLQFVFFLSIHLKNILTT